MDSNSTRTRADRAQLSVLLDAGLVVLVRSAARARGMTIAAFVERALEVGLDGYVDVGPGGGGGVAVQGGDVGQFGGRGGVDGVVSVDSGRGLKPDWVAILAAGREERVPVRDTVSQVPSDWTMEIA